MRCCKSLHPLGVQAWLEPIYSRYSTISFMSALKTKHHHSHKHTLISLDFTHGIFLIGNGYQPSQQHGRAQPHQQLGNNYGTPGPSWSSSRIQQTLVHLALSNEVMTSEAALPLPRAAFRAPRDDHPTPSNWLVTMVSVVSCHGKTAAILGRALPYNSQSYSCHDFQADGTPRAVGVEPWLGG